MTKKFYVVLYDTYLTHFEVDRYLTSKMKIKSEKDIQPIYQFQCETWVEADYLYCQLKNNHKVVAKFEGNNLLVVTNKN